MCILPRQQPGDRQESDSGTEPVPRQRAEWHKYCLYFLVCKAQTGPLAGLFKLGVSDCLARRHHEHVRRWNEFDLSRSALVRADSRDEVQHLETTLRRTFGAPRLEAGAKAAGRTLASEELIAAGSFRRHPGQCAQGWTEFYAMECWEKMLETTEHLLARRGECKAGASLQRGITPADLAPYLEADADCSLFPDRGPGSGKRKQALRRQEWDESDTLVEAKVAEVLAFALAHESDLCWVNLHWWRFLRFSEWFGSSSNEGLVDLYFDPCASTQAGTRHGSVHRPAARIRFEENLARINPVAAPAQPRRWRWTRPQQVFCLLDLLDSCHTIAPPALREHAAPARGTQEF